MWKPILMFQEVYDGSTSKFWWPRWLQLEILDQFDLYEMQIVYDCYAQVVERN